MQVRSYFGSKCYTPELCALNRSQSFAMSMRSFKKMSTEEMRLAKMWFQEDGMMPSEIAKLLHRNKSTLTRFLVMQRERKQDGRPRALTEKQVYHIVEKLEEMIIEANQEYRVTVDSLKRALRLKVCSKILLEALHERDIYFRPNREKPDLTEKDIEDRKFFADTYAGKSAAWWVSDVHMSLDVKFFKVYTHSAARSRAAREGSWGSFRTKAQGLLQQYIRPSKRLRWNPGARGVHVLAGIGNGKVLLWEYIDGRRWCGQVAAEMY